MTNPAPLEALTQRAREFIEAAEDYRIHSELWPSEPIEWVVKMLETRDLLWAEFDAALARVEQETVKETAENLNAEPAVKIAPPPAARLDLEALVNHVGCGDVDVIVGCPTCHAIRERLRSPGAGEARLRAACGTTFSTVEEMTAHEQVCCVLVRAGLVPGEKEQP